LKPGKKEEIITFKVDESLAEEIKSIKNRSDFIRKAILNALKNTCPLCSGTGILTPEQRKHWNAFAEDHHLQKCAQCNEYFLVCELGGDTQ